MPYSAPQPSWLDRTDYFSLGLLADQDGEPQRAEAFFRDSLQLAFQIRELDKIAYLLDTLAGIAVNRRDYFQAARLLAAGGAAWNAVETDAFRKTVEALFPENERDLRREWEATIRTQLREEWEVIRQTAATTSMEELVVSALRSSDSC